MATPGTDARIYTDGFNLSTFLRSLTVTGSADVANIETFGDTYKRYQTTLKDSVLQLEGFLDTDEDAIDQILAERLGVDGIIVTVAPAGDANGNMAHGLITSGTAYEIQPAVDGVVGITATLQSSIGRDRLIIYHAAGAETAEDEGAGVDGAAASTAGAVAVLQVLAFEGDDVVVAIQTSSDNGSGDAYANRAGLVFDEVTAAPFAQRLAVTGSIERWTRWAITGTFDSVTFQLGFQRL